MFWIATEDNCWKLISRVIRKSAHDGNGIQQKYCTITFTRSIKLVIGFVICVGRLSNVPGTPTLTCLRYSSIYYVFTSLMPGMSMNVHECPEMSRNVQKCPGTSSNVQDSWRMSKKVQNRPGMSKVVQECPWMSTNVHECPWMSTNVPECPWISTNVHECPRISMNVHKCPRKSKNV